VKVGDLVGVHRTNRRDGTTAIVTGISPPTLMFPRELVTVTFADGEVLEDLPSGWVEVLNESR